MPVMNMLYENISSPGATGLPHLPNAPLHDQINSFVTLNSNTPTEAVDSQSPFHIDDMLTRSHTKSNPQEQDLPVGPTSRLRTPAARPNSQCEINPRINLINKPPKKKTRTATISSSRRQARGTDTASREVNDSLATEAPTTSRGGRRARAKKKIHDSYTVSKTQNEKYTPTSPPPSPEAMDKYKPTRRHNQQTVPVPVISQEIPLPDTVSKEQYIPRDEGDEDFAADIEPYIIAIADLLGSQQNVQIELPETESETVWSAQDLIQLYIACYKNKDYHSCDLITDTWIRAFHRLHKPGQEYTHVWRPLNRKYVNHAGTLHNLYLQQVEDPALDYRVTDFNMPLINSLYRHTKRDCGARLLWADAMALCGSDMEDKFDRGADEQQQWHPDLIFNVMCTSLRMVRKRLTLKIEEYTEGAWCNRYHLHGKSPCYRKLAKDGKARPNLQLAEQQATGEQAASGKRGIEEVADVEAPPSKKVQFALADEGMDIQDVAAQFAQEFADEGADF